MSDARKRAEEALASALVTLSNKPRYADLFDEVSNLRDALRAVLAEAPTAPPADAPAFTHWTGSATRPDAPPADAATEAVRLLREVASAGVEFEDDRISYTSVQIDSDTWAEVRAFVAALSTPAPAPSAKEGRT